MDTRWNQHTLAHDSTGILAYSSFHQQLNKNQGGFLIAYVQNIQLWQWKKWKKKQFKKFSFISFELRLFLHHPFHGMQISSELLNLSSFCTVFHSFLIDLAVEEHLGDTKEPDSPHLVCCSVRAGAAVISCRGRKAVIALILFSFGSWIYSRHLTYRVFYNPLK